MWTTIVGKLPARCYSWETVVVAGMAFVVLTLMSILRTRGKEIIISILFIGIHALAFLTWSRIMPLVISGAFQEYAQFIPPVLLLIFSAMLFSLGALFGSRMTQGIMLVTLAVSFLLVSRDMIALILAMVAILMLLFALYRIRRETTLSMGFSTSKSLRAGLPLYFTAAAFLVTTFFLNQINEATALSALLPKPLFQSTLRVLERPIASSLGLPNLDGEKTVDEAIESIVKSQLESQHINVGTISSRELTKLIVSQRGELARTFNLQLTGTEKVQDVFYTAISSRLGDLVGPYKGYIPAASALAFFFAFKAFTFPLYFVTLISVVFMVKLLLLIGVLRREKQTIDVERVVL